MCKIFRDKQIVGRKIFQLEPRHCYKAPGGGKSWGWQNIQNLLQLSAQLVDRVVVSAGY